MCSIAHGRTCAACSTKVDVVTNLKNLLANLMNMIMNDGNSKCWFNFEFNWFFLWTVVLSESTTKCMKWMWCNHHYCHIRMQTTSQSDIVLTITLCFHWSFIKCIEPCTFHSSIFSFNVRIFNLPIGSIRQQWWIKHLSIDDDIFSTRIDH